MKKVFGTLMISSVLLTGCVTDKLDEMGERTGKMLELSTKLESYSSCMKRMNAGVMYKQMRSGNGAESRDHNFDSIGGAQAVKGMGDKLYHSSVFFKAYEHQLFSGEVCAESTEDAKDLELNATKEFSKRISDLSSVNKQFDPNTGEIKGNILKYTKVKAGGAKGKKNTMMTFLALATAMHVEHHFQKVVKRNGKEKNLQARTFYDILKEALIADANNEANSVEMELVSGPNREIMINLLRARYNFLAVLAVKDLTNKADMTFGQKAAVLADRFLNVFGIDKIDIEIPMTHLNEGRLSTLRMASKKLDAALKVRRFMDKMGIAYTLDEEISEILNDVYKSDFQTKNKRANKEFNKVINLTDKLLN